MILCKKRQNFRFLYLFFCFIGGKEIKNHNSFILYIIFNLIFNIFDDTNEAVKVFDRHFLLLPHGNFAIELQRVERTFEIHGAIAHFSRIKNATDLLDHERSMICIYDINGDLLDEVQLINLPQRLDFFIDDENYSRFVTNDNEVTKFVQIIQNLG